MWLDKITKGHEMAIMRLFLHQEIHELQASDEKQREKRKQFRKQIAIEEGLFIQEGQDLILGRSQEEVIAYYIYGSSAYGRLPLCTAITTM